MSNLKSPDPNDYTTKEAIQLLESLPENKKAELLRNLFDKT